MLFGRLLKKILLKKKRIKVWIIESNIAKKLLELYPEEKEGVLDKKFASLVNKKTCLEIAKRIELDRYILVLNPTIIKIGKMISNNIAGQSKKPGKPNPLIQSAVFSKLKILLYPDNKKTEEIKILPKRSKILFIINLTLKLN